MAWTSSGSSRSARAVKSTRSMNRTETTLRSSVGAGDEVRGAAHAWQKRARSEFSSPQFEQVCMPGSVGEPLGGVDDPVFDLPGVVQEVPDAPANVVPGRPPGSAPRPGANWLPPGSLGKRRQDLSADRGELECGVGDRRSLVLPADAGQVAGV